jgi:hypothetical protein
VTTLATHWPPRNAEDLKLAANNGLLVEGHFVDLKRELPEPGKNVGIAIDLAAFSVDGGTIFLGVDERSTPAALSPIALRGVAERVEQVGLASVDPPVSVRAEVIDLGAGVGVVVVIVPPSPRAPHMVDGRYYARGDRTNHPLSDIEVTRIRGRLDGHANATRELLMGFVDTARREMNEGPLLAMIARPVPGRADMVLSAVDNDPPGWVQRVLLRGPLTVGLGERWSPDFYDSMTIGRRANGWSISAGDELDLEIHEDGLLRLRAQGLDMHRGAVNDVAINGLVKRVLLAAFAIARDVDYLGSWDFDVAIAPLRDRISGTGLLASGGFPGRISTPVYSEEGYGAATSATWEELEIGVDVAHRALMGRLNRAFGGRHPSLPT